MQLEKIRINNATINNNNFKITKSFTFYQTLNTYNKTNCTNNIQLANRVIKTITYRQKINFEVK